MIFEFDDLSRVDLIPGAIYKGGNYKTPTKDDPLSKLFIIEGCKRGIGNMSGFRKTRKENRGKVIDGTVAFVVAVDTGKQSDWPNYYNEETGIFTYYGDNKTPGNDIHNTKQGGNKLLREIFTKSYSGSKEQRLEIPPIFIFKSTGNGCDKEFVGLAVPGIKGKTMEESLKKRIFEGKNGSFENYEASFTVLNISENIIKREWLKELKDYNNKSNNNAPKAWNEFIEHGLHSCNSNVLYNNRKYYELEVKEEEYLDYNNEVVRKVKVRVTQGKFRDKLLARDKQCVICKLDIEDLLVASHIKPWSESNDYEKQDENNGIILCASHDALFDKGYVSFDENGSIIISEKIDSSNYNKLNIDDNIIINLNKKQILYMNYHKNNILK